MTIEQLKAILPIPEAPYENDSLNWFSIEKTVGIKFPVDYKSFVSIYGTGQINEYFYVLSPVAKNENLNLMEYMKKINDMLFELYDEKPPLTIFPDSNGLIPWGYTDNGEELFWITKNRDLPNKWTCFVYDGRSGEREIVNNTMSEFLLALFYNRTSLSIFNHEPFLLTPNFTPLT